MKDLLMKIALIHDWLIVNAGAEKVIKEILEIFPNADIFSLVDFLNDKDRKDILQGKYAKTSFIQKLPKAKTKYRNYLPLFPLAIEQFNLNEYNLIISSSHAVAKGVLTNSNQIHICYCHTPIRYAWDLYHQYLKESNLNRGFKGLFAKYFLHKIRIWDVVSSSRVDYFIANSKYIAKRIKKIYRKDSVVIYPPVDVDKFDLNENKENFYLTVSRLVPYKKVDLIVEAFNKMPDKKLIVIGDGPDIDKIKSKANKNIEILGYQSFEVLKKYMETAKAFVFAAEEDFGILPIEAQACGTPVIAYRKGGVLETVIDGKTGIFFDEQNVTNIIKAVNYFEEIEDKFNLKDIRNNALKFSKEKFKKKLTNFINIKYNEWEIGKN